MNKRILAMALVAACGVLGVSVTAFAGQAGTSGQATQPSSTTATAKATVKGMAKPVAGKNEVAQQTVVPLDSNMCIRDTGSHIRRPKGECLPVAGRSYSLQDIRRTGAINLGQALEMLDPAITVHGH